MRSMRWMRVLAKTLAGVSLVMLGATAVEGAQGGGMAPNFRGGWHPVVGSGGAYRVEEQGQPAMDWEVTVVGREGDAYWVETHMSVPEEMVSKILVRPGAAAQSMIVKSGADPAMELPLTMAGGQTAPETDVEETAERIGSEQITTPAGSFACEHYRSHDDSGVTDVWVNADISPYGLVKMTSSKTTMVLTRVITGATTRITETPQKIEFPAAFADMLKNR